MSFKKTKEPAIPLGWHRLRSRTGCSCGFRSPVRNRQYLEFCWGPREFPDTAAPQKSRIGP
jgi:hypothetical protein